MGMVRKLDAHGNVGAAGMAEGIGEGRCRFPHDTPAGRRTCAGFGPSRQDHAAQEIAGTTIEADASTKKSCAVASWSPATTAGADEQQPAVLPSPGRSLGRTL